jgi:SPP1 family predicted phage head-tail adaptor
MKKDPTGQYNKRVTLLFPSGTTVVDGVEVANYLTGATVWASFDVKTPKGRQVYVAEADHGIATRWIKIRYVDGVDSTWRVRYRTTVFKIVSPPLDEGMQHRELYLELEVVG